MVQLLVRSEPAGRPADDYDEEVLGERCLVGVLIAFGAQAAAQSMAPPAGIRPIIQRFVTADRKVP